MDADAGHVDLVERRRRDVVKRQLVRRADQHHRVLELRKELLGALALVGLLGIQELGVLVDNAQAGPGIAGGIGPARKPVDLDKLPLRQGNPRRHGSVGAIQVQDGRRLS